MLKKRILKKSLIKFVIFFLCFMIAFPPVTLAEVMCAEFLFIFTAYIPKSHKS